MAIISVVAGGAGFIGSHIVSRLLDSGRNVTVIDNFSNGDPAHIGALIGSGRLKIVQADLSNRSECEEAFRRISCDGTIAEVWHLAANSDIPIGVSNADVDHKDTFLTTFEILRAMRNFGVPLLHFASSSAIYGDLGDAALHEAIGPLLPISNYGAMKLASEAQASAAAEAFLERVNIFRFPNVVGVPATHGVILDFVRMLSHSPGRLPVLGDGSQQKAYLHVSDLVDAMFFVAGRPADCNVEVVNIGPVDDGVRVSWIAEMVVGRVSPGSEIVFGEGKKGWIGDVPRFRYSTARLTSYGWSPRLGSAAAVERAIDEIARQLGR
jgi:UDP-glucose 4-epimerase